MGLLSSIINLGFVVAAGWFVIYYLVPKFEAGEFGDLGLSTALGGSEGSLLEEQSIPGDIIDFAMGEEPGTTEGEIEAEAAAAKEPSKKKGEKKGKGEWLSSDLAGKDNRKKSKKKSKSEIRLVEYLGDYYNYGLY